jgi:cytochrome c-type biogenesis protein CcmH/NrfG
MAERKPESVIVALRDLIQPVPDDAEPWQLALAEAAEVARALSAERRRIWSGALRRTSAAGDAPDEHERGGQVVMLPAARAEAESLEKVRRETEVRVRARREAAIEVERADRLCRERLAAQSARHAQELALRDEMLRRERRVWKLAALAASGAVALLLATASWGVVASRERSAEIAGLEARTLETEREKSREALRQLEQTRARLRELEGSSR